MGRGKNVKRVKDFLKEPYLPIIELFMDTKNRVLRLKELRYLLLEDHGLKMIIKGTTRGHKLVSEKMFFRGKERSLKAVRPILQREGRMLRNTTGTNMGQPMNTNGLNRLLQTMMSARGPEVLKKAKGGYQLVGNPFHQFVRAEREKRVSSCPDRRVCELRHGLTIYNLQVNKKLVKQLNRREELHERLGKVQEEVMGLWAKRKINLFVGKLKALRSLHGNGNFLGYCSEMVRWFVGSLGLDGNDFEEELKRIEEIAKNHRTRKEARAYGEGVRACKEILKETKMKIAISHHPTEKGTAGGPPEMVETSLLNLTSILSIGKNTTVADTIRELVEDGIMGKMAGELLLLDQEMSKLYGKHGLDEYLSSATLREEPIIVIESH